MLRYLNFRCSLGLCNRIRGLLCAIGVAEATNRRLIVTWEAGPVCGATMDDLWDHDVRLASWLGARIMHRTGDRQSAVESRLPLVYASAVYMWRLDLQPRPWIENYKCLRIKSALQRRVDDVVTELGGRPVLGVSVRAHPVHAHKDSLVASPPAWYEQRIATIVAQHPGLAVFVSSDDSDLADAWAKRWPGTVVALPGKGRYGSTRGVQDALCDLHILAGCSYILGAHHSSLSGTAGTMQGGAIETSVTPSPVPLDVALAQRPSWCC